MSLDRLRELATEKVWHDVRKFAGELAGLDGVLDIILFGSMAENKMTQASDIDIAIIIADDSDKQKISAQIRELRRNHIPWPVDLVILKKSWFESRKDYGGLCFEINNNGKWLFSSEGEIKDES